MISPFTKYFPIGVGFRSRVAFLLHPFFKHERVQDGEFSMFEDRKFTNRREAGKLLAERLKDRTAEDPVILALPKGGVPVAFEIAERLEATLDVLIVRKIGHPMNPEFGIGALVEDGTYWVDPAAQAALGVSDHQLDRVVIREAAEAERRVAAFRGNQAPVPLRDRVVIIVDDGLATGVTAVAAIRYAKSQGAKKVTLAVPVCAPDTADAIRYEVDEILCLEAPESFQAVGIWYDDFTQVSDDEVVGLLQENRAKPKGTVSGVVPGSLVTPVSEEVRIQDGAATLEGHLEVPRGAEGLVLFAHGSGSSRHSPRNVLVSNRLHESGVGTLLFDLLTPEESVSRANTFDIPLLARRLVRATRWVRETRRIHDLALGYFGASTGAAAALIAAAELGDRISAVVSRGGRPDMAIPRLGEVHAPTLLLVGGNDHEVIELNREAAGYLRNGRLVIVPGAGHLFEEPGTLEAVSDQAANWFRRHLRRRVIGSAA